MTLQPSIKRSERQRNPRGQGERLREEILDAADALLAESGDARTLTLRGVAKRVGIAATSIYLQFPDVEHLKHAVVERGFAELAEVRHAASRDIGDPCAALLARLRAYAHFGLEHPGWYRLMFGPELPPELAYQAERSPGRQALQDLASSVQQCQRAAAISPTGDPIQLAILVWSAVHGIVMLRIDRPGFPWPPLDDMVDTVVRRIVQCPSA